MVEIELPVLDETVTTTDEPVRDVIQQEGTLRLSELEDELDHSDVDLRLSLFRLLEDGDVALYPVANSVIVEDDS